eukprot:TRINITY_DN19597_c0_g1::TRINITY_DN19597_c0_g1_i1::g.24565::m.24565 TRINITY_DN19597_c0_g1::TRINITY_DN19597_c0_g1_i1::g.24565  ORF type:complete len:875 (+),score=172.97,sp/Q94AH8/TPS6_ARATH/31.84/9e-139,Glyco_transf_20/PF00982.16/1.7e-108,Trehalose_PPase/PF02358.11/1e-29 TRINITY_DN19597_c0_g1_i1:70-2694(+)
MRRVASVLQGKETKTNNSRHRSSTTSCFPLMPEECPLRDEELPVDVDHFQGESVVLVYSRLPIISQRVNDRWEFAWHEYSHDRRLQEDTLYLLAQIQQTKFRVIWTGCLDVFVEQEERDEVERRLFEQFNCVPVFLNKSLSEKYHRFCHDYLGPLFHHHVPSVRDFAGANDPELWKAYCEVNRLFGTAIVGVLNEGDMVWIHDMDLALVPTHLIRRVPKTPIGLFMHSPFPSSDIYRTLPMREEILRGMLNTDLVGFHVFEHTRHFLTSCMRMLGAEYEIRKGGFLGLKFQGRHVMLRTSHASPNVHQIIQLHKTDEVTRAREQFMQAMNLSNKTVLIGYDELAALKGVSSKLLAYERLLQTYSIYQGKIVLIQVAVPEGESEEIHGLGSECRAIADRINARWPDSCYYIQENIGVYKRHALWSLSDLLVNTTLRGGLCLTPHEYILSCKGPNCGIIMSEFVACARALTGLYRVNPYSVDSIVGAIDKYMQSSQAEKDRRFQSMYRIVRESSTMSWAESILLDVKRAHASDSHQAAYLSLGLGLNMRSLNIGDQCHLDADIVVRPFSKSLNRVIIVDCGGGGPGGAQSTDLDLGPDSPIISALQGLAKTDRTTVYLVTGYSDKVMKHVFKEFSSIGLGAEHGYHLKPAHTEEWTRPFTDIDLGWKAVARPLLESYTERTSGSQLEETYSTLVWSYAEADPDLGVWQAKDLLDHLSKDLRHFGAKVANHSEQKCIEISPSAIRKVDLIRNILESIHKQKNSDIDFLLYVEDNVRDKTVCEYLTRGVISPAPTPSPSVSSLSDSLANTKLSSTPTKMLSHDRVFTVSLGLSAGSGAQYYMYDFDETIKFFEYLLASARKGGFSLSQSVLDLASMDQ